jgi:hypothetical protein
MEPLTYNFPTKVKTMKYEGKVYLIVRAGDGVAIIEHVPVK